MDLSLALLIQDSDAQSGVPGLKLGQILIMAAGYAITLGLSGYIVRFFTPPPKGGLPQPEGRFSAGVVIGKCENILTVTLVLMNELTGLALLFAAKSLVRKEDIRANSQWFLGGMMVNLTWGVVIGFLTRIVALGG